MGRIAIFIDGGYLDKVLRNEFGGARIAYELLSRQIATQIDPSATILRTYYYHCLPYQSNPPTSEESNRFAYMQNFLEAINRLPRFDVKLGRLARRVTEVPGQYLFEQKMIDVLLCIDVVRLSAKGQVADIAIVAGDGDFAPALKTAKEEGVAVWLFHGDRPHNELLIVADERIRFTPDFISRILWKH